MTSFEAKVYQVVSEIPKGQVLTYKEVAILAGRSRAYRAVGNIMNKNPDTKIVPCHRVVRSDGRAGGYASGTPEKIERLKKEGVLFDGEMIIKNPR
ncbi:MAG: cysteine methyltransferase [Candidatus Harrisonbacteria bacterium CG10_big_fil_rev_8_21_14_0_10_40_38]|uniref:Cysteine methyltransferase n=1 Tax=Candidatus Harrisonbacteria bacterium CG10_big_fil_rev_8_21_14_0_10_40_38 TaxID=1974583 RepID=A0A2H0URI0_9BACT|nr:MAG: cysteine methyltransferase [Candidatus Harrisonbacteria bacterium CG10_big_fil_rev_8_21_14_0_10_40_38]